MVVCVLQSRVSGPLVSYGGDEKKIERKLQDAGFFALVTPKLEMGTMEVSCLPDA
jgi:hypothetical protein